MPVLNSRMPRAPVVTTKLHPETYALKTWNVSGFIICSNSSVKNRHQIVKIRKEVKLAAVSKTTPECLLQFWKRFNANPPKRRRMAGTVKPATMLHFGIGGWLMKDNRHTM